MHEYWRWVEIRHREDPVTTGYTVRVLRQVPSLNPKPGRRTRVVCSDLYHPSPASLERLNQVFSLGHAASRPENVTIETFFGSDFFDFEIRVQGALP